MVVRDASTDEKLTAQPVNRRQYPDSKALEIACLRMERGCFTATAAKTRVFGNNTLLYNHYKGVKGEMVFGQAFNLKVDSSAKPFGDGRVDFILNRNIRIDVKTTTLIPPVLLREAGKLHADILVLAQYRAAPDQAFLIGWEWDDLIIQWPSRDYYGSGVESHRLYNYQLRDMQELVFIAGGVTR